MGLTTSSQEAFTDIIPVHEVAHQWWGNVVGWSNYRDQWIDEGLVGLSLAAVSPILRRSTDRALSTWLARYRKQLVTKPSDSDIAPGDIGPVTVGSPPFFFQVAGRLRHRCLFQRRLDLSHASRNASRTEFSRSRRCASSVPAAASLVAKYAQKPLSTEQFQKEVEAVMTPEDGPRRRPFDGMVFRGIRSWNWHSALQSGIHHPSHTDKGLSGARQALSIGRASFLHRAGAAIHWLLGGATACYWERLFAAGDETSFSFYSQVDPHKILIDPHMTLLLCSPEYRSAFRRDLYFVSISCFSSSGLSRFSSALPPSPST